MGIFNKLFGSKDTPIAASEAVTCTNKTTTTCPKVETQQPVRIVDTPVQTYSTEAQFLSLQNAFAVPADAFVDFLGSHRDAAKDLENDEEMKDWLSYFEEHGIFKNDYELEQLLPISEKVFKASLNLGEGTKTTGEIQFFVTKTAAPLNLRDDIQRLNNNKAPIYDHGNGAVTVFSPNDRLKPSSFLFTPLRGYGLVAILKDQKGKASIVILQPDGKPFFFGQKVDVQVMRPQSQKDFLYRMSDARGILWILNADSKAVCGSCDSPCVNKGTNKGCAPAPGQ